MRPWGEIIQQKKHYKIIIIAVKLHVIFPAQTRRQLSAEIMRKIFGQLPVTSYQQATSRGFIPYFILLYRSCVVELVILFPFFLVGSRYHASSWQWRALLLIEGNSATMATQWPLNSLFSCGNTFKNILDVIIIQTEGHNFFSDDFYEAEDSGQEKEIDKRKVAMLAIQIWSIASGILSNVSTLRVTDASQKQSGNIIFYLNYTWYNPYKWLKQYNTFAREPATSGSGASLRWIMIG